MRWRSLVRWGTLTKLMKNSRCSPSGVRISASACARTNSCTAYATATEPAVSRCEWVGAGQSQGYWRIPAASPVPSGSRAVHAHQRDEHRDCAVTGSGLSVQCSFNHPHF